MLRRFVNFLASRPALFDMLRSFLEGGFRGHHQLLALELPSSVRSVLDIGCGTGIYAAHFDAARYQGIDISQDYVLAASDKFPSHSFQVMDARHMSFPDEQFDAAFISGVLHHLSDQDAIAVLQEAARVLRPGGRLLIWEDIPAAWWNPVGHIVHALDLGSHIRLPAQYRTLIEQAARVDQFRTMRSGFMDYGVFVCQAAVSD